MPGSHAGQPPLRVELDDLVDVLGEVDDDGDVAALPGERRAAAAPKERRAVLAADAHGLDHVLDVARDDDADRHLAVVGGVGRVERAAAVVEADLAADVRSQLSGERLRLARREDLLALVTVGADVLDDLGHGDSASLRVVSLAVPAMINGSATGTWSRSEAFGRDAGARPIRGIWVAPLCCDESARHP